MSFRHEMSPRFQDVDAAGIVFYARFFGYFHDAYVAFLESLGTEMALQHALKTGNFLMPLVHSEADFKAPLRFGDRATTTLWVSKMGQSSFTLSYQIHRVDGQLVAQGQTVHACVTKANFSPCPLPERLRAGLMEHHEASECE
ncbi:MAG TPA: acyl-CoA thioesterase [Myxococcales bacterium]|nr:hypothetical protein [Myxococcales bacterium]HBU48853.1 acyl-CoA thioesterase [Myxococcales bacterium]|tara:strand:+ start:874 stop:1302 length:429 start_codon:yes stop_codon:yes gene_type:complete